jgi:hypothetical protein
LPHNRKATPARSETSGAKVLVKGRTRVRAKRQVSAGRTVAMVAPTSTGMDVTTRKVANLYGVSMNFVF